jgi:hypothetical protein
VHPLRRRFQGEPVVTPERIFQQELPEGLDENWTHGALLGGVVEFSNRDLANFYFNAGDTLIARVSERKQDGMDVVHPALFLYRHGIELFLKAIVRPINLNHNLGPLLTQFAQYVLDRYQANLPRWFHETVSELAKYDPKADAFRYAEPRSTRLRDEGEVWVDLGLVQRRMSLVRWVFERTLTAEDFGLRDLDALVPNPFVRDVGP